MKLNVGCGRDVKADGWTNLDAREGPGVDIVCNLEQCASKPIPLPDDSVEEFLLSHVLEHLHNPLPLMQELHRIGQAGAIMTVRCPYGSSNDADEDPTHVRRLYEGSFGYFGQPFFWKADYGYRGDWEVARMILALQPWCSVKEGWVHAGRTVRDQRNQVREMIAVLRAVKPIRAQLQNLQTPFTVELMPAETTHHEGEKNAE